MASTLDGFLKRQPKPDADDGAGKEAGDANMETDAAPPPSSQAAAAEEADEPKRKRSPAPPSPAKRTRLPLDGALTEQARDASLAAWAAEAEALLTSLRDAAPLVPWPEAPPPPRAATARVAAADVIPYLVGRGDPISEMARRMCAALGGAAAHPGVDGLVTVDAARSAILDAATRRCVSEARPPADADPLEDATPGRLWTWDLRDARKAPPHVRAEAAARKKATVRAGDRLAALAGARVVLTGARVGAPLPSKVRKAVDKLARLDGDGDAAVAAAHPTSPSAPPAAAAADAAAAASRVAAQAATAAAKAERARAAAEREQMRAERERLKLEKERRKAEEAAARAAERAAREAAKEAARLEKETARLERERAKEAAKVAKDKAKTVAAAAKKTKGKLAAFGSEGAVRKSASVLASFVKRSPATGAKPAGSGSAAATPATATRRKLTYHAAFPPAPPELCARPPPAGMPASEFDAALAAGGEVAALATQALARWKAAPRPPVVWGAPPTWSRRPDAVDAAARLDRAALEADGGRLWRRKFIWHPADSARPPYFGSWTKPAPPVGPRRFAAKHPDLDYEVASDEEWEEEPEGEDLSDADDADDDDDRASAATAATGDGFFVPDDHVSGADGDDFGGAAVSGLPAGASAYMRLLAAQLDTARRGGRLALVSRLGVGGAPPVDAAPATSAPATPAPPKGVLQCDVALLAALAARPWRRDDGSAAARVVVPPPTTEDGGDDRPRSAGDRAASGAAAAASPPASPSAAKRARTAVEAPADLVPALRAFMARSDVRAAPRLAAAFQEAHADRKMTKAWLLDAIKAAGVWKGGRWTLHPEGGAAAPPPPRATGDAPAPPPLAEPWASLVATLKAGRLPPDEATAHALVAPVHEAAAAVPTGVVAALVDAAAPHAAAPAFRRAAATAAATALHAAADAGRDAALAHGAVLGGGRLPAAAAALLRASTEGTRRAGGTLLASAAQAAVAAGRPAESLAAALASGAAFGRDGVARALAVPAGGATPREAGHTALAVATLLAAPDGAGAALVTPPIVAALAAAAAATAGVEGATGPTRGLARRALQALACAAAAPAGRALLAPGGVAHAAADAAVAAAMGNDALGEDGAAWVAQVAAVVRD